MPELSINVQELTPTRALVSLKGFLDAHTFEQLDKTLQALFARKFCDIIINLAKIDYISSAGAGVFIGSLAVAQENGGNIILSQPQNNIREIFDLLGLSQIFHIATDNEAALKQFK